MSSSAWADELLAVPTDAEGRYKDPGCIQTDGAYVGSEIQNANFVRPGEIADFEVEVCGDPGATGTFHFRMASKWFSPKPLVFGPIWTVTVQFPTAACLPLSPGAPLPPAMPGRPPIAFC